VADNPNNPISKRKIQAQRSAEMRSVSMDDVISRDEVVSGDEIVSRHEKVIKPKSH